MLSEERLAAWRRCMVTDDCWGCELPTQECFMDSISDVLSHIDALTAENERLEKGQHDAVLAVRLEFEKCTNRVYADRDKLKSENERLRALLLQAREALRLTREYVAPKVELPAVPGWAWYDATVVIDAALDREATP